MKRERFVAYTEDYKRIIFQVWYANGRPNIPDLLTLIPKDTNNRVPSIVILRKWKLEDRWDERADTMDTQAIVVSDDFLIRQKSEMLMRQAHTGFVLQQLGLTYLISGSFDSSSAAVNAVIRGAELERTSRGIGEMIMKMSKMSDVELEKSIMEDIRRASDAGQMVLDAEREIEEENDTESTDLEE